MKTFMKSTLPLAFGLGVATLALPALAQDTTDASTMTCADFTSLDPTVRMDAVHAAEMANQQAMEAGGAEKKTGDSMMSEEAVAAVLAACDGHPDMMLTDAVKSGTK